MSTKKVRLQRKRTYSEEFKKVRVKEYENGDFTVGEISKIFNINTNIIYRWIYKYSHYNKKNTVVVEMKNSATNKLKEYEKRIAELERIVGQKQLNIDFLEKMIELAKEHYDIDLKKNLNTSPLNGSSKTKEK